MNNDEIYDVLRQKVEHVAEREMQTPRDFDYLSTRILDKTKAYLAPITLKRFWGYLGEKRQKKPFRNTLNVLAVYAGYTDIEVFENCMKDNCSTESDFLPNRNLNTASLYKGTVIELKWHPDRCVVIRYEGFDMFRVIEAANSKLQVGDTFQCYNFIDRQPLYLRCLVHSNGEPTGYVCGKENGIQYRILDK